MNNRILRNIDIVLMVIFPVVAAVIATIFKTNFFISNLLFLGVPSLYIILRKPAIIKKCLLFGIAFSIPLGIAVDYIGVMSSAWSVPQTLFNRFLGVVFWEDVMWGFLWGFFAISFYEYFWDQPTRRDLISKNLKYLLFIAYIILIIILIFNSLSPELLNIRYYFIGGGIIVLLLPIFILWHLFPKPREHIFKTAIYFLGVMLLYELVGVSQKLWIFPSKNYVGFFELFGVRFPIEEFLFAIIFGTTWLLVNYEFFIDDRR